jgi:hypothetical protein
MREKGDLGLKPLAAWLGKHHFLTNSLTRMKVVQLSVCEGPDERGWVYERRLRMDDASVNRRGACPRDELK